MKVLGIIPARGGSKGIRNKNLHPCAGKPLLQWTAEAALAARLDRVVLSTDSEQIAAAGQRMGLEVPWTRPQKHATDTAPTIAVVKHCLTALNWTEAFILLQPTNPLRLVDDIDRAAAWLREERLTFHSILSVSDIGETHPWRTCVIDDGALRWTYPPGAWVPRQGLPRSTAKTIQNFDGWGTKIRPLEIPPERSCRVDTMADMWYAEGILRQRESLTEPAAPVKKAAARPRSDRRRRPRKKSN
jgi:CMP-N-acetylneuraminic acid synthetase